MEFPADSNFGRAYGRFAKEERLQTASPIICSPIDPHDKTDMMSYYEDLSAYDYCIRYEPEGTTALNVGWLSSKQPFTTGETSYEFRDLLLRFCRDSHVVHIARGFHVCELCNVSSARWYADAKDRYGPHTTWASIGDGEVRVFGKNAIYAAPTLIYHYVFEHSYLPPDGFIDAVLTGPAPESVDYKTLLKPA